MRTIRCAEVAEFAGVGKARARAMLAEYSRACAALGRKGKVYEAGELTCEECGFSNPERVAERDGFMEWYREVYGDGRT